MRLLDENEAPMLEPIPIEEAVAAVGDEDGIHYELGQIRDCGLYVKDSVTNRTYMFTWSALIAIAREDGLEDAHKIDLPLDPRCPRTRELPL